MENIAIIPAYMTDTGKQLEMAKLFKKQQNRVKVGMILFFLLSSTLFLFVKEGDALSNDEDSQSIILAENHLGILPRNFGKGGANSIEVYNDTLYSRIGFDNEKYQDKHPAQEETENGIRLYIVQKGDTLSEIAEKFGVSINTIKWENNLTSNNTLRVGKELRILPVTGVLHTVRKGDTLSSIAKRYDVPVDNIKLYNNVDEKALKPGMKLIVPNGVKQDIVIKTKSTSHSYSKARTKTISSNSRYRSYFIRPSQGRVTSPFGPRRHGFHYGIDYGHYWGAPIVASAGGVVEKVVSYCSVGSYRCGGGYGNNILIRHSNGTKTRYAHLKSSLVKAGQRVEQGQKIGMMGNTGNVRPRPRRGNHAGTHLHFEISDSRTGRKINPNFLR